MGPNQWGEIEVTYVLSLFLNLRWISNVHQKLNQILAAVYIPIEPTSIRLRDQTVFKLKNVFERNFSPSQAYIAEAKRPPAEVMAAVWTSATKNAEPIFPAIKASAA